LLAICLRASKRTPHFSQRLSLSALREAEFRN
jgi:hypothetical protein